MFSTHQTSSYPVLPLLRPAAVQNSMSTRILRDRRRYQYQRPSSDLGLETTQLSPLSPYNTRKRKRDSQIGSDSGYQTEDSSTYDDSSSAEPRRRLRPRKDSVNYQTVYSPTSSWYPNSPSTPSRASQSSLSPNIAPKRRKQKQPAPQEIPSRPAVRGHGLILTFKETDLPPCADEISAAFNAIHCSAQTIYLDSPDLSTSFQEFLEMPGAGSSQQPRIVYVASHGVGDPSDKLHLCSHGPLNTGVTVPWSAIQRPIATVKANVLVILTCCHGGLAKLTNEAGGGTFAKEMITTASWAESTFAYLGSTAFCVALDRWYWASAELSGWALYEALTRVIKEIREDEIRRGNEKISVLEERVGSVKWEVERLEAELKGLDVSGMGTGKVARKATAAKGTCNNSNGKSLRQTPERDSEVCAWVREKEILEKMIRKQKRLLREVMEDKVEEEEVLQENRNHYTQPHFMRAEVRALGKAPPGWTL